MPFIVGQTVFRNQPTPNQAVVLEVIDNIDIDNVYYKIQYIEGATSGNDGTGYWPETALFI